MTENILRFQEPLPFHRPRWITALCLILWSLAHIFGVLAIVFFSAHLNERGILTVQDQPASQDVSSSTPLEVKLFDMATHRTLEWGTFTGAISMLLILIGFGMWRKRKWFILPLFVLILVLLPGILSALR